VIVRSADGTTIGVERVGDGGDGPPLVVVPGALSDVASWSGCAPLLADGRSVYVVDRRGRGASGDAEAYEVEREIEDVLAVLDGLARPTDLLGHSSGAILALGTAERSPAHLRRLVLYEPPVFIGDEDRIPPDLPARLDTLLAEGDEAGALETFLREGPRTPDPEIEWLRAHQGWQRMLTMVRTVPYDARISQGFDLEVGRLTSMQTPTLMLIGSLSPPRMRHGSEAIAASLPDVLVEELDGQAHLAQVLAPDAFAAAVLRFLAG
jgi:pimeloyl-ACP methyl ester carboxylesterase